MNVLVTGAAGFIGHHLVRRLLADGHAVVALDNLAEGRAENLPLGHPRLCFRPEDILDAPDLLAGVEVLFHLAALPRVQRSLAEPLLTHQVNVDGTHRLLCLARTAELRRFIFASSSSVYGEPERLPLTEDMPLHPLSPYALHKLMGEQYCALYQDLYGVPTVALRFFNVYGPNMNVTSPYANLIPRASARLRAGQPPHINGDGEQTRDFTYVDDVVAALLLAAEHPVSGVLNVGSGCPYAVNEVVELLRRELGGPPSEHGPAVVEPRATCAGIAKISRVLGWRPQVDLYTGLHRLLEADAAREAAEVSCVDRRVCRPA